MASGQAAQAKPLPSRLVPASVMQMMAPRVARPKVEAAKPEPVDVANEFSVNVSLTASKLLGIDVDWADGKTLYIKSIQPGAIDEWNWNNAPTHAVRAGDRIVAVNGLAGDATVMVRECRANRQLQLLVRTKRRPLAGGAGGAAPVVPWAAAGPASGEPVGGGGELPSSKRARPLADTLYSGMPAPDPEKDKSAGSRAKEFDIFADSPAADNPRLAVFLDIDGVLRRLEDRPIISLDGELLALSLRSRAFAPEAVKALRFIVHRTGASVVLSSEWRRHAALHEEVATALRAVGLPPLRGATVVLEPREELVVGPPAAADREATLRLRWAERRAREISSWLREHPEVGAWVALDDIDLGKADEVRLPDTLWMSSALVLTSPDVGLTLSNARHAVELLLKGGELGNGRPGETP